VPDQIETRRSFIISAALTLAGCAVAREPNAIRLIEEELGGRVGVSFLDTHTRRYLGHRATERFALCSTFKALLAAAVLARIDDRSLSGSMTLQLPQEPLLSTSPIATAHLSAGRISVLTACEAVVSHSDNTAANLLLELIGGPPAMTRYFRSLGDDVTRLDRYEMALNSNIAGDERDTTTPDAMTRSLRAVLLDDALTLPSRSMLTDWMLREQRGAARIRAGVPAGWRVANKPGTSANGAINDIAVVWPPDRRPIVMALYVNAPSVPRANGESAIARVAHIATTRSL
jgi:beta-lactamase class A